MMSSALVRKYIQTRVEVLTVVTPAGYDLTPVIPAFFASRMTSGVIDSCR
jgi:hypothetical protein